MKTHIVIHHSLTDDGSTVSWGAIERYHKETKGWKDIGYHYGVERIGDDYYCLLGRAEVLDAAACKEGHMNSLGIHVCCVGNYDLLPPPETMLDVLIKRIIIPVMRTHVIPIKNIVGHRDFATYKSCPGLLFDMDAFRQRVREAAML